MSNEEARESRKRNASVLSDNDLKEVDELKKIVDEEIKKYKESIDSEIGYDLEYIRKRFLDFLASIDYNERSNDSESNKELPLLKDDVIQALAHQAKIQKIEENELIDDEFIDVLSRYSLHIHNRDKYADENKPSTASIQIPKESENSETVSCSLFKTEDIKKVDCVEARKYNNETDCLNDNIQIQKTDRVIQKSAENNKVDILQNGVKTVLQNDETYSLIAKEQPSKEIESEALRKDQLLVLYGVEYHENSQHNENKDLEICAKNSKIQISQINEFSSPENFEENEKLSSIDKSEPSDNFSCDVNNSLQNEESETITDSKTTSFSENDTERSSNEEKMMKLENENFLPLLRKNEFHESSNNQSISIKRKENSKNDMHALLNLHETESSNLDDDCKIDDIPEEQFYDDATELKYRPLVNPVDDSNIADKLINAKYQIQEECVMQEAAKIMDKLSRDLQCYGAEIIEPSVEYENFNETHKTVPASNVMNYAIGVLDKLESSLRAKENSGKFHEQFVDNNTEATDEQVTQQNPFDLNKKGVTPPRKIDKESRSKQLKKHYVKILTSQKSKILIKPLKIEPLDTTDNKIKRSPISANKTYFKVRHKGAFMNNTDNKPPSSEHDQRTLKKRSITSAGIAAKLKALQEIQIHGNRISSMQNDTLVDTTSIFNANNESNNDEKKPLDFTDKQYGKVELPIVEKCGSIEDAKEVCNNDNDEKTYTEKKSYGIKIQESETIHEYYVDDELLSKDENIRHDFDTLPCNDDNVNIQSMLMDIKNYLSDDRHLSSKTVDEGERLLVDDCHLKLETTNSRNVEEIDNETNSQRNSLIDIIDSIIDDKPTEEGINSEVLIQEVVSEEQINDFSMLQAPPSLSGEEKEQCNNNLEFILNDTIKNGEVLTPENKRFGDGMFASNQKKAVASDHFTNQCVEENTTDRTKNSEDEGFEEFNELSKSDKKAATYTRCSIRVDSLFMNTWVENSEDVSQDINDDTLQKSICNVNNDDKIEHSKIKNSISDELHFEIQNKDIVNDGKKTDIKLCTEKTCTAAFNDIYERSESTQDIECMNKSNRQNDVRIEYHSDQNDTSNENSDNNESDKGQALTDYVIDVVNDACKDFTEIGLHEKEKQSKMHLSDSDEVSTNHEMNENLFNSKHAEVFKISSVDSNENELITAHMELSTSHETENELSRTNDKIPSANDDENKLDVASTELSNDNKNIELHRINDKDKTKLQVKNIQLSNMDNKASKFYASNIELAKADDNKNEADIANTELSTINDIEKIEFCSADDHKKIKLHAADIELANLDDKVELLSGNDDKNEIDAEDIEISNTHKKEKNLHASDIKLSSLSPNETIDTHSLDDNKIKLPGENFEDSMKKDISHAFHSVETNQNKKYLHFSENQPNIDNSYATVEGRKLETKLQHSKDRDAVDASSSLNLNDKVMNIRNNEGTFNKSSIGSTQSFAFIYNQEDTTSDKNDRDCNDQKIQVTSKSLNIESIQLINHDKKVDSEAIPMIDQDMKDENEAAEFIDENERAESESTKRIDENMRDENNVAELINEDEKAQNQTMQFLHEDSKTESKAEELMGENERAENKAIQLTDEDMDDEKEAVELIDYDEKAESESIHLVDEDKTAESIAMQLIAEDVKAENEAAELSDEDEETESDGLQLIDEDKRAETGAIALIEDDSKNESESTQVNDVNEKVEIEPAQLLDEDRRNETDRKKLIDQDMKAEKEAADFIDEYKEAGSKSIQLIDEDMKAESEAAEWIDEDEPAESGTVQLGDEYMKAENDAAEFIDEVEKADYESIPLIDKDTKAEINAAPLINADAKAVSIAIKLITEDMAAENEEAELIAEDEKVKCETIQLIDEDKKGKNEAAELSDENEKAESEGLHLIDEDKRAETGTMEHIDDHAQNKRDSMQASDVDDKVEIGATQLIDEDGKVETDGKKLIDEGMKAEKESGEFIDEDEEAESESIQLIDEDIEAENEAAELIDEDEKVEGEAIQLTDGDMKYEKEAAELSAEDEETENESIQLTDEDMKAENQEVELIREDELTENPAMKPIAEDTKAEKKLVELIHGDKEVQSEALQLINEDIKSENEEAELIKADEKTVSESIQLIDEYRKAVSEKAELINEDKEAENESIKLIDKDMNGENDAAELINENEIDENERMRLKSEDVKAENQVVELINEDERTKSGAIQLTDEDMNDEKEAAELSDEDEKTKSGAIQPTDEEMKDEKEAGEFIYEGEKPEGQATQLIAEDMKAENEKAELINAGDKAEGEAIQLTAEDRKAENDAAELTDENKKAESESIQLTDEDMKAENEAADISDEVLQITNEDMKAENQAIEVIDEDKKAENQAMQLISADMKAESDVAELIDENEKEENESIPLIDEDMKGESEAAEWIDHVEKAESEGIQRINEDMKAENEVVELIDEDKKPGSESMQLIDEDSKVVNEKAKLIDEDKEAENESVPLIGEAMKAENDAAELINENEKNESERTQFMYEDVKAENQAVELIDEDKRTESGAIQLTDEDMKDQKEAAEVSDEDEKAESEAIQLIDEDMKAENQAVELVDENKEVESEAIQLINEDMKDEKEVVKLIDEDEKAESESIQLIDEDSKVVNEKANLIDEDKEAENESIPLIDEDMSAENNAAELINENKKDGSERTQLMYDDVKAENQAVELIDEDERTESEAIQLTDEGMKDEKEAAELSDEDEKAESEAIQLIDEDMKAGNEKAKLIDEYKEAKNESTPLINEAMKVENRVVELIDEDEKADSESIQPIDEDGKVVNEKAKLIDEDEDTENESIPLIDEYMSAKNDAAELINENKIDESEKTQLMYEDVNAENQTVELIDEDERTESGAIQLTDEAMKDEKKVAELCDEDEKAESEAIQLIDEDIKAGNEKTKLIDKDKEAESEAIQLINKDMKDENEAAELSDEDEKAESEAIRLIDEDMKPENQAVELTDRDERTESGAIQLTDEDKKAENKLVELIDEDKAIQLINEDMKADNEVEELIDEDEKVESEAIQLIDEDMKAKNQAVELIDQGERTESGAIQLTNEDIKDEKKAAKFIDEGEKAENQATQLITEDMKAENDAAELIDEDQKADSESMQRIDEDSKVVNEKAKLINEDKEAESEAIQLINKDMKGEKEAAELSDEDEKAENEAIQLIDEDMKTENEAAELINQDEKAEREAIQLIDEDMKAENQAVELIDEAERTESGAIQLTDDDMEDENEPVELIDEYEKAENQATQLITEDMKAKNEVVELIDADENADSESMQPIDEDRKVVNEKAKLIDEDEDTENLIAEFTKAENEVVELVDENKEVESEAIQSFNKDMKDENEVVELIDEDKEAENESIPLTDEDLKAENDAAELINENERDGSERTQSMYEDMKAENLVVELIDEDEKAENQATQLTAEDMKAENEEADLINAEEKAEGEAIQLTAEDRKAENEAVELIDEDEKAESEAIQLIDEDMKDDNKAAELSDEDEKAESEAIQLINVDMKAENVAAELLDEVEKAKNESIQLFDNDEAAESESIQVSDEDRTKFLKETQVESDFLPNKVLHLNKKQIFNEESFSLETFLNDTNLNKISNSNKTPSLRKKTSYEDNLNEIDQTYRSIIDYTYRAREQNQFPDVITLSQIISSDIDEKDIANSIADDLENIDILGIENPPKNLTIESSIECLSQKGSKPVNWFKLAYLCDHIKILKNVSKVESRNIETAGFNADKIMAKTFLCSQCDSKNLFLEENRITSLQIRSDILETVNDNKILIKSENDKDFSNITQENINKEKLIFSNYERARRTSASNSVYIILIDNYFRNLLHHLSEQIKVNIAENIQNDIKDQQIYLQFIKEKCEVVLIDICVNRDCNQIKLSEYFAKQIENTFVISMLSDYSNNDPSLASHQADISVSTKDVNNDTSLVLLLEQRHGGEDVTIAGKKVDLMNGNHGDYDTLHMNNNTVKPEELLGDRFTNRQIDIVKNINNIELSSSFSDDEEESVNRFEMDIKIPSKDEFQNDNDASSTNPTQFDLVQVQFELDGGHQEVDVIADVAMQETEPGFVLSDDDRTRGDDEDILCISIEKEAEFPDNKPENEPSIEISCPPIERSFEGRLEEDVSPPSKYLEGEEVPITEERKEQPPAEFIFTDESDTDERIDNGEDILCISIEEEAAEMSKQFETEEKVELTYTSSGDELEVDITPRRTQRQSEYIVEEDIPFMEELKEESQPIFNFEYEGSLNDLEDHDDIINISFEEQSSIQPSETELSRENTNLNSAEVSVGIIEEYMTVSREADQETAPTIVINNDSKTENDDNDEILCISFEDQRDSKTDMPSNNLPLANFEHDSDDEHFVEIDYLPSEETTKIERAEQSFSIDRINGTFEPEDASSDIDDAVVAELLLNESSLETSQEVYEVHQRHDSYDDTNESDGDNHVFNDSKIRITQNKMKVNVAPRLKLLSMSDSRENLLEENANITNEINVLFPASPKPDSKIVSYYFNEQKSPQRTHFLSNLNINEILSTKSKEESTSISNISILESELSPPPTSLKTYGSFLCVADIPELTSLVQEDMEKRKDVKQWKFEVTKPKLRKFSSLLKLNGGEKQWAYKLIENPEDGSSCKISVQVLIDPDASERTETETFEYEYFINSDGSIGEWVLVDCTRAEIVTFIELLKELIAKEEKRKYFNEQDFDGNICKIL